MRTLALAGITLLVPSFAAAAADLYLSPAQASLVVGQPATIILYADTGTAQGNAVDADISYDPALLSVSHISKEGSVLSTWSTDPVAENGSLRFSGWADARFSGSDQVVLRFDVTPNVASQGSMQFRSGTVLSPDVQETNILTGMRGLSYSAVPASTVPPIPVSIASTTVDAQPVPRAPEEATGTAALPMEPKVQDPGANVGGLPAAAALAGDNGLVPIIGLMAVFVAIGILVGFLMYRADREVR